MKRNYLILILMFFALSAGAQQIKQDVIASAGGYNKVEVNVATHDSISISWTLGETIIATFVSDVEPKLTLTQGFHQTIIKIATVVENIEENIKVTVYPNPTSEIVNILFETPVDREMILSLFNSQGGLVKTDKIEVTVTNKQINMQDLPAGLYYLRISKGRLINVYKVVKL